MARTHGSRLDALEQTAMRFILKSEMLERENAELLRTIERLKARIEKLEAAGQQPQVKHSTLLATAGGLL